MIDFSKVRVGDKLTLEATVTSFEAPHVNDGEKFQVVFNPEKCPVWIPDSVILSHTPAPRELAAGDNVRITDGGPWGYRVKAIVAESAWISHPCGDQLVCPVSALTLVS